VRGFRKPTKNYAKEGTDLEKVTLNAWPRELAADDIVPAIVTGIEGKVVRVRVGRWTGTIDPEGYAWTKRKAEDLGRRGDLVEVKVDKLDAKKSTFTAKLDQALVTTGVQGAVLAIENRTGQVLAMIGGSDFADSMFNRALQARRQVGSLFKPFVFTAAVDRGMTAADTILDSPQDYLPGPNQPLYSPKNYENDYEGWMTLRHVLAHSRNVPTVKLMHLLTPEVVVPYARQLGIKSPIPAFLSTAIGSAEGTLIEMVSAYSAYPNQGVRMEPIFVTKVTDREGNVLEENYPQPHEALKADTAAILTSMLESVVKNGTASTAASLDWPLGGKTGTTDDFTDAWFVGFDPDITIGVWIGYDQKKTLGEKQAGAQVALPVWTAVMKSWIDRQRVRLPEKPKFLRPSNVVDFMMPDGKVEVFIAGTAPGKQIIEK
jgi:penicillin-binding protein 1A